MKKFVINLPSRPDRKEAFIANNPHLTDVNWLVAVDGKQLTLDQVRQLGFDIDVQWRDPFKDRRLTKGEVGCFLSHYFLWRECVSLGEPILILEDDAIVQPDDFDNLPRNYALVYLGYNENKPDNVMDYSFDSNFVYPSYPYNAHAYIITPELAQQLLEYKTIIPVDELLYQQVADFEILAYKTPRATQVSRSVLGSDIEPFSSKDFFQDYNNIHVLTVGTDRLKMKMLNDSAAKYGIYPKNLGNNVEWNGGDMVAPGGMHKLHLLYDYIQNLDPNDIILFTDAYDVFYADDLENILQRYFSFNTMALFGAEKHCWPLQTLADKYPPSVTPYRYLNSGCFIGRVGLIKQMLETPPSWSKFQSSDDDQLFLTNKFLQICDNPQLVKLDTEHYIFNIGTEASVSPGSKQLRNPTTFCTSCIYHGAGPASVKSFAAELYSNFAPPTGFHYIPNKSPIQYLSKDMLVVDFMTQSQCEHMIELAEKYGNWGSLPDDKFPAQEIRLKKLGLYDTFVERWEQYVYPIVEKYWFPLKMYGLRDAFVMKYTKDTQTSLSLHNDASLVTGSVKLNEDYTGGVLSFPRQDVTNFQVPVGKCILFPGQVTHCHESTELQSGVKYSLTMWTSRYNGDYL